MRFNSSQESSTTKTISYRWLSRFKILHTDVLFAHVITVKVLIADPNIPANNAPNMDSLTNFGNAVENQSAIPGRERYPANPIPNPSNQNASMPRDLDI